MEPDGYQEARPPVTQVTGEPSCVHHPIEGEPKGYLAWHAWASKKNETHKQLRCPMCGLWNMWRKR